MTVNILLVEDHLSLISGLRADIEGGAEATEDALRVHDPIIPTMADAVSYFEGLARHGAALLRTVRLDGVMIDGHLPLDNTATNGPQFVAVDLAMKITALYDAANIPDELRPRLVLTTAAPDPCVVRAFIAYGGAGVVAKTGMAAEELRRRLLEIVRDRVPWSPPPARPPHGYRPGLALYLRELEHGGDTGAIATRTGHAAESVTRSKYVLRQVFGLHNDAIDEDVVEAAKEAGITWVPRQFEERAKSLGVRPRLPLW